jgi:hypothetical protein
VSSQLISRRRLHLDICSFSLGGKLLKQAFYCGAFAYACIHRPPVTCSPTLGRQSPSKRPSAIPPLSVQIAILSTSSRINSSRLRS